MNQPMRPRDPTEIGPMSRVRPWTRYLSDADIQLLERAGYGQRIGFGARPAVLVIDVQNYMLGDDRHESIEKSTKRFPASAGERAWVALDAMRRLLKVARASRIPIFFTTFVLRPDGSDVGVYGRKRRFLQIDNWCLEGTYGAELSSLLEARPDEIVLTKKRFSAFWGTPLLGHLVDRGVDTLIVTGGSTSNCVRATVFDAASYNFRTTVVEECVFDRFELSHWVSLFEMERQFADVASLEETIRYLQSLPWTKPGLTPETGN